LDGLLEAGNGRVVAIEVKSTTAPRSGDAPPLGSLRDKLDRFGSDLVVGVVFHTGDRRVCLDDRLIGLPIADLWTYAASSQGGLRTRRILWK
jgi:uncharacterized protein